MPKNYSKSKIAIIIGWNLKKMDFSNRLKLKRIKTPYGKINYYQLKNCFFFLRHGIKENIPPHKINYLANIIALKKLGVKFIFSFNSVGSLKKGLKPGIFLVPSDYIGFGILTFYNNRFECITPEISQRLRKNLIKILKKIKIKFKQKGVYFETRGPRLETKAEINLIKKFADVVGMTMAKEATLAQELNMEYASLCSVDNFAHGVTKKPLTVEGIEKNQKKNKKIIERIIREILKLKL